jgi:hypothetical protein
MHGLASTVIHPQETFYFEVIHFERRDLLRVNNILDIEHTVDGQPQSIPVQAYTIEIAAHGKNTPAVRARFTIEFDKKDRLALVGLSPASSSPTGPFASH